MSALVLNDPLIISLRKSKLRKVYLAIKEAEFELESGGVISDRNDEQKNEINQDDRCQTKFLSKEVGYFLILLVNLPLNYH